MILFGYATLADNDYLKALLGKVPRGFAAKAEGYELCIQDYKNMPELVQKAVVENGWKPEEFKSYFARRSSKPSSAVGKAWRLNAEQEKVLDDWEFEGLWYQKESVEVVDVKGRKHRGTIYAIPDGIGTLVKERPNPYPVDKQRMLALAERNNLIARTKRGEA